MEKVVLDDKIFRLIITESDIAEKTRQLAIRINNDLVGEEPVFLVVLNGAFMFATELLKNITVPCEISFIRLASYTGTKSNGRVNEVLGIERSLKGRVVVILEDIVDTGITLQYIQENVTTHGPKKIHVAAMLFKSESYRYETPPEYIGFRISNDFVVGYGLDYNEFGRNLRGIYREEH